MKEIVNFYDTETTGLNSNDKVISIGMVLAKLDLDENTLTMMDALELFNMVDVPISAGAENAHGISPKLLLEKSGGKRPEDVSEDIEEMFELSNITYAYNRPFDSKFIKRTYGIDVAGSRVTSDNRDLMIELMAVFGKRVKQEFALEYYLGRGDITKEQLDADFLKDIGAVDAVAAGHNALYDAYCLARLYAMAYGLVWKHDAK